MDLGVRPPGQLVEDAQGGPGQACTVQSWRSPHLEMAPCPSLLFLPYDPTFTSQRHFLQVRAITLNPSDGAGQRFIKDHS